MNENSSRFAHVLVALMFVGCRPDTVRVAAPRAMMLAAAMRVVPDRADVEDACTRDRASSAWTDDVRDEDHDGLDDACEQALAERFAPIVFHSTDETNWPTNVDRLLASTRLAFYDDACSPDRIVSFTEHPTQKDLVRARQGASCGRTDDVTSGGTLSARKHRTFFLQDVDSDARAGSDDTREWTTYFHAYRNEVGGVTVQYWRLYAYNDSMNDHGGDWEAIHVVLDASLAMRSVRMLAHERIDELSVTSPLLSREGTHVRVFSEGGGHASRASGEAIRTRGCAHGEDCFIDVADARTFVRQETWTNGEVRTAWRAPTPAGALMNLGSKTHPMNGQVFLRYSGLWGSPGAIYGTSGYWGPAFNETQLTSGGFVTAWCAGMVAGARALDDECRAPSASP